MHSPGSHTPAAHRPGLTAGMRNSGVPEIFHTGLSGGCVTVCICQKSLNNILKKINFTLRKFRKLNLKINCISKCQ